MKLYLKNIKRNDLSFIEFKEVLGLNENPYQSQSLTFQNGKYMELNLFQFYQIGAGGEVHDL
ncbi:hypothetical protein ACFOWA_17670 [Pedobacter lithocola]|uniref:Uncharacterized protein n=1 Tax=Pedobacter lithocola TaxID=1908239 RepID=A0ABV8PFH6_9SPHI